MSSHLGVFEMLELLDRLKSAVRNFAAREEELAAEFRSKSIAETKAAETASWQLSTQLSESLARAETAFTAGKSQAQARYENYRTRLHQAHRASRKRALEAVDQQEGRRKYQLQKSSMEADHRRETDLAKAAARVAELAAG